MAYRSVKQSNIDQEGPARRLQEQRRVLLPPRNIVTAPRGAVVHFDTGPLRVPAAALADAVLLFPGSRSYIPRQVGVEGKNVLAKIPNDVQSGFVALQYRTSTPRGARPKRDATQTYTKNGLCRTGNERARPPTQFPSEAVLLGFLTLQCPSCAITCPENALLADPHGECHVDPARCIGQTFTTDVFHPVTTDDGRTFFPRIDEEHCWACFNTNDETVSTMCNLRRLRKVAFKDDLCCGHCDFRSKLTGLDLMELCPNGAVSLVPNPDEPGNVYFINNDLCTGCMNCFENLNCFNNLLGVKAFKMVAHADNDRAGLYFTVHGVQLSDAGPSPIPQGGLPGAPCLVVRSDFDQSTLQLRLEAKRKVTITPANNATGVGRYVGLALVTAGGEVVRPTLLRPAGGSLQWPVTSALVPPFCHSGAIFLPGKTAGILYSVHE